MGEGGGDLAGLDLLLVDEVALAIDDQGPADDPGRIEAERGDTIGGLVFNTLERAPRKGEAVEISGYRIKCVDVSGSRIARVQITQIEASNGARGTTRRTDGLARSRQARGAAPAQRTRRRACAFTIAKTDWPGAMSSVRSATAGRC